MVCAEKEGSGWECSDDGRDICHFVSNLGVLQLYSGSRSPVKATIASD